MCRCCDEPAAFCPVNKTPKKCLHGLHARGMDAHGDSVHCSAPLPPIRTSHDRRDLTSQYWHSMICWARSTTTLFVPVVGANLAKTLSGRSSALHFSSIMAPKRKAKASTAAGASKKAKPAAAAAPDSVPAAAAGSLVVVIEACRS